MRHSQPRFAAAAASTLAVSSNSFPHMQSCAVDGCKDAATRQVEEIPVLLKPSRSARRKASFYIPRMREQSADVGAFPVEGLGSALPLFAITSGSCEYFALRLPLLKAGFKRLALSGNDVNVACNVVWGKSPRYALRRGHIMYQHANAQQGPSGAGAPPVYSSLALTNRFQKFNHFPSSHKNLGCKRGMANNLRRAEQRLLAHPRARTDPAAREMYAFSPKTWFYPEEQGEMLTAFRAASPSSHFIWKPARGSCGRGIYISKGGSENARSWQDVIAEIAERGSCEAFARLFRHYVVQEYVENPLLLDGRKMDLRLYVTVTSYNPLTVYLHEEGLVRLAAEPYYGSSPGSATVLGGTATSDHSRAAEAAGAAVPASTGPRTDIGTHPVAVGPNEVAAQAALSADAQSARDSTSERFRHLTNYSIGRKYASIRQQQQQQQRQHQQLQESEQRDESTRASGVAAPTEPTRTATFSSASALLGCATAEKVDTADEGPQLKWSLSKLWAYLDSHHRSTCRGTDAQSPAEYVKERIALVIVRTLLGARRSVLQGIKAAETSCGYFELYGFDIMLDRDLNPSLIEINTLPSLESSSDFDYSTKCNVVADLLNISMIEPFARSREALEPLTSCRSLLSPPRAGLQRFVNSQADSAAQQPLLSALPPREQREEMEGRLADELLYARGFKRIFPPVADTSKEYPISSASRRMKEDLRLYSGYDMLTKEEEWTLSSSV